MVEFVEGEVETSDQRAIRPVLRVERDECRFHVGQLRDRPFFLCLARDADDCAGTDAILCRRFGGQCGCGETQAAAADLDRFAG